MLSSSMIIVSVLSHTKAKSAIPISYTLQPTSTSSSFPSRVLGRFKFAKVSADYVSINGSFSSLNVLVVASRAGVLLNSLAIEVDLNSSFGAAGKSVLLYENAAELEELKVPLVVSFFSGASDLAEGLVLATGETERPRALPIIS